MFEKYKARRDARRAAEQQRRAAEAAQHAQQEWQQQRAFFADALALVRDFHGEASTDLVLKTGEAVYASVGNASLIEDRAGRGQWKGGSQGVSIPVGSLGGRTIRYHVGATRGHYVQGTPVPTAIDTGTVFVTNRRVVFRGAKQNRECLFDKLLSVEHGDGESTFAVSNRQKNTILHYGSELDGWFRLRFQLAFADHQGTRDQLVAELAAHVAALDRQQPGIGTAATDQGVNATDSPG